MYFLCGNKNNSLWPVACKFHIFVGAMHGWLIPWGSAQSQSEIFAGNATKNNMKMLTSCDGSFKSGATLARRVYFTRTHTLEDRLLAMRWRHSSLTIVVRVQFWTPHVLMWIEFAGSLLQQERFLLWHCCFPPPPKLTFDWNVNEIVVINRVDDACKPP